jgi:hypothetical protein
VNVSVKTYIHIYSQGMESNVKERKIKTLLTHNLKARAQIFNTIV